MNSWLVSSIVIPVCALGFFALERAWVVSKVWTQKQHLERPLSDAVDGPVILRGKLMAPAGRVAPTGQSAAVWYFEVFKKGGGEESPVCRLADVSNIWLAVDHAKVPLLIAQSAGLQGTSVVRSWLAQEPEGGESILLPKVLAECRLSDCKSWFDPSCSDVYFGREVVIPPGTEVTVVGCKAGDHVKGCEDGLDMLSSRGIGPIGESSTWASVLQFILVLLVGLYGAATLGGSELRNLVDLLQPEGTKG